MQPQVPTVANPMGGRRVAQINGVEIPSWMIGETSVNIEEGSRTSTRLSGTSTSPSGNIDTAEVTLEFFPNQWEDLAHFFPELYEAPSGSQTIGRMILGGGTCSTKVPVPFNFHEECADTDDRDVYFPAALARLTFNPTFNDTDDVSVTITMHPQPNSEGMVRLGTGDLTQPSVYDPETETTVPVGS